MPEDVSLVYTGGLADNHQLHFYEHSRANYGFARLLITAEYFRRHGTIVQKINKNNYVGLIIEAPEAGSFVTTVVVPAITEAVPKLAAVPLKAVVAYIFQLICPRSKKTDETVIELAKIRLAESQERTAQSREETERIKALKEIVESQSATTSQALELVKNAIEKPNRAVARLEPDSAKLVGMANELLAERNREIVIGQAKDHLENIDPKSIAQLTSRVRPMFSEMAKSLKRSAESFTIGAANDDAPLGYFDPSIIAGIESREVLEDIVDVICRIKSFDRDAGVGKVKSDEFRRVLNFIVSPDRKNTLQPKILAAMRPGVDEVVCQFLKVVDKTKQPTSLILMDIPTPQPSSQ